MRASFGLLALVAACEIAGAPPAVSPLPVPPSVDAGAVGMARPVPVDAAAPAPSIDAGFTVVASCPDPAIDAAKRAHGTVDPARWLLDLDGDGVYDPAYTSYCSMMGGNCATFLYASAGSKCPRFVGQVQVTRVSSGPVCAEPSVGHAPCRLSASRMMIHGEIYEYFYTYSSAGYAESGVGDEGPRPPRH